MRDLPVALSEVGASKKHLTFAMLHDFENPTRNTLNNIPGVRKRLQKANIVSDYNNTF